VIISFFSLPFFYYPPPPALNIIRIGANMRLIDLDASASYKDNEGEISGRKYSSGYVPPEMIYCNEAIATVRSPLCKTIYVNKWMSSTFYDANVEGLMQHADDVDAEENIELDFECVPAHPGAQNTVLCIGGVSSYFTAVVFFF
jgi:hypothetical protein